MKIGILTFHTMDNYGCVFQVYALQEVVKQLNYGSVEIIDYQNQYINETYRLFKISNRNSAASYIKCIFDNILFSAHRYLLKIKYRKFRDKYINISARQYLNSKDINGYDVYIVGSDQVWNNEITKDDETFYLGFCEKKAKKIAYGASLGFYDINSTQLAMLKRHIDNIDYISVREDNAVKTLTPLTTKKVTQVLDPVLLVNQELWDSFIKINRIAKPYLVLYRIVANDELYDIANAIAQQLHLQVIYIHFHVQLAKIKDYSNKPNKYGFKNVRCVGPQEFLTLVKNAKYVVTNSFHTTIFSIIFNKNFVVIPHEKTGARVTSLLTILKLNERIIANHNQISDKFNFEVDYRMVNEILIKEKENSMEFLKDALRN
jgi:hypothetical protein